MLNFLKYMEEILSKFPYLTSSAISLTALIISIIALYYSQQKPALELRYNVHQSDEDMEGIYYKNGKGVLKFAVDLETKEIDEYEKTIQVDIVRPETSLNIILENKGDVSAKYPAIYIKFNNFRVMKAFNNNWTTMYHYHGTGGWGGVKWEPKDGTILHPGIPIEFYELSLSNAVVEIGENLKKSMTITIVADGFKARTFNIPVIFYDKDINGKNTCF